MIDTITSFSWLFEIINLEKSCKLFHDICKRNTHQIITTKLYTKYVRYYQKEQPQEFKLKHIKKISLFINSNTTVKLFTPTIKFHTNLIDLELDIYVDDKTNLISNFCSNIPNNIKINTLCFSDQFYECLIPKIDGCLDLSDVTLTVEQMNSLNHSNITKIELWCCEFTGDIKKINLRNWKLLQQCCVGFDSYCDFMCQSLLLHPPNLSNVRIHGIYEHNPLIPTKSSKNIKVIRLTYFEECLGSAYKFNFYKMFFINMEKQCHKFDAIYFGSVRNINNTDVNHAKDVFKFIFDHIFISTSNCFYCGNYDESPGMVQLLENCLESFGIKLIKVTKDVKIKCIMLTKISKDAVQLNSIWG